MREFNPRKNICIKKVNIFGEIPVFAKNLKTFSSMQKCIVLFRKQKPGEANHSKCYWQFQKSFLLFVLSFWAFSLHRNYLKFIPSKVWSKVMTNIIKNVKNLWRDQTNLFSQSCFLIYENPCSVFCKYSYTTLIKIAKNLSTSWTQDAIWIMQQYTLKLFCDKTTTKKGTKSKNKTHL